MNIIAAVSKSWGIGYKNDLLFRIPSDLARFKKLTMGKTIIMGHNTFKSLPGQKPLPGRENIVLSRTTLVPNVLTKGSVQGTLAVIRENSNYSNIPPEGQLPTAGAPTTGVFVIGGGMIYREFLPYCTRAYITKVDTDPPADVFLPNFDLMDDWEMTEESEKFEYNGLHYNYCTYVKAIP